MLNLNIVGEVLPKITDRMELAGYDDRDIMAIRAIAFHSGVNGNDAIILKADAERSVQSLIGKPLRILFDNNNPTGHGYNRITGAYSKLVTNIGFISWSYMSYEEDSEDTNEYKVIVEIGMWKKYYPEIAKRMRELHQSGELYFSIEAEREFEVTPDGLRRCFNIMFRGLAVVQSPAWQESRSLMVAEILKEGGQQNMEEILKLLEGLKDSLNTEVAEQFKTNLGVLNDTIVDLKQKLETANTELSTAKEDLITTNCAIKTLEGDRDAYKSKVETAEKETLGTERLEKLSKYGKVENSVNELAELDKEAFLNLLEKMVDDYKPEIAETKPIGVKYEKIQKTEDRKQKLLSFVSGLK